jgi:hypothetical protein
MNCNPEQRDHSAMSVDMPRGSISMAELGQSQRAERKSFSVPRFNKIPPTLPDRADIDAPG